MPVHLLQHLRCRQPMLRSQQPIRQGKELQQRVVAVPAAMAEAATAAMEQLIQEIIQEQ